MLKKKSKSRLRMIRKFISPIKNKNNSNYYVESESAEGDWDNIIVNLD